MSTAQPPFDPYRKWLGIPVEEQPPHHYRLLGLGTFEADLDVISHAADRCMGHVRTFQAGSQVDLCQRVLNELAAARLCLLGANTKAQYDRQLQAALHTPAQVAPPTVTRVAPTAAVMAAPAALVTAIPVTATPVSAVPVTAAAVAVSAVGQATGVGVQTFSTSPIKRRRRRNRISSAPVVLGGLACLALLAGLLGIVLVNQSGNTRKKEDDKPRTIIIQVPAVKPQKDASSLDWSGKRRPSVPSNEPRYKSSDQLYDDVDDRRYRRRMRLE